MRANPCTGSSPHARGTPAPDLDGALVRRFIPAYAGNARWRLPGSSRSTVHPRIRGERGGGWWLVCCSGGSSPHTRGTPEVRHGDAPGDRFIPAYAGNASCARYTNCATAVHPRIRGERSKKRISYTMPPGSSPHTRGTPQRRQVLPLRRRFIPAYAGNALLPDTDGDVLTVHPRIRGERACRFGNLPDSLGSSPHTRGTLLRHDNSMQEPRFIPAYAGNACRVQPRDDA